MRALFLPGVTKREDSERGVVRLKSWNLEGVRLSGYPEAITDKVIRRSPSKVSTL